MLPKVGHSASETRSGGRSTHLAITSETPIGHTHITASGSRSQQPQDQILQAFHTSRELTCEPDPQEGNESVSPYLVKAIKLNKASPRCDLCASMPPGATFFGA